MRVLVTGGAGFIGSHLAARLLDRGDEVAVIDNISTGRIENVAPLVERERFKLVIDTVCNPTIMEELIRNADHVYHLAAPVGVKYIMSNPVRTILENTRAADVVFEFCNKYRKKVLLASSSEVYGKNLDYLGHEHARLGEDDLHLKGSTKNHRWAYATTKSLDEFLGFAYFKQYGMPVVVVRFFNTVGPRQVSTYGMVIPTFVRQALESRPITVYGTGEQQRSFLYIEDALDAITALMDEPRAVGDVFNVGHEREITINALAERVRQRVGATVEIQHVEYRDAYGDGFEDMLRRVPDISKIRRLVGFEPKFALDQIIDRVVAHARETLATTASPGAATPPAAARPGARAASGKPRVPRG